MGIRDLYLEEDTKTNNFSLFSKIVVFFLLFWPIYGLGCLSLLFYSKWETDRTIILMKKGTNPELLTVFTGDRGRIPFALKTAEGLNHPPLFITGVYSKNTVKSILAPYKDTFKNGDPKVEIDYAARNTFENVISTFRYLKGKKNHQKVMIISHDYHIPRIRLIVESLKRPDQKQDFLYYGIETKFNSVRKLKILTKELFKFIRTFGFLVFWEEENI